MQNLIIAYVLIAVVLIVYNASVYRRAQAVARELEELEQK